VDLEGGYLPENPRCACDDLNSIMNWRTVTSSIRVAAFVVGIARMKVRTPPFGDVGAVQRPRSWPTIRLQALPAHLVIGRM
jgi:hypothetical protein